MDKKFLITVNEIPYPNILIPKDTVKYSEWVQIKNAILTDTSKGIETYAGLTQEEIEQKRKELQKEKIKISVLFKDQDGDMICLGKVLPSQIPIFTTIFQDGISGSLDKNVSLTGSTEIEAILGE